LNLLIFNSVLNFIVIMTSSPRELSAQNTKLQKDQEKLIQDLLGILDDLDNACEHWQQAAQDYADPVDSIIDEDNIPNENLPSPVSPSLWQRLWYWFVGSPVVVETVVAPKAVPDLEVVASASEGVEMIRRSLLDVLRRQQVVPLDVLGKTFDPARMYAMGRQECAEAAENTVVQEVVRGYLWQNRVLRESQVMVAVKPATADRTLE
jgi:molecular chaperone GrpE (heat shock protein)